MIWDSWVDKDQGLESNRLKFKSHLHYLTSFGILRKLFTFSKIQFSQL